MRKINEILEHLIAEQECTISLRSEPKEMPSHLPEDVKFFFERSYGGHIFYRHDFPTPQFGCEFRFPYDRPVSEITDSIDQVFCEGPEFAHLWIVAEHTSMGEADFSAVSTLPDSRGYIYFFPYSLGDPMLTWDSRLFLASSFARWLDIHIEAWDTYLEDWRSGLKLFGELLDQERQLHPFA